MDADPRVTALPRGAWDIHVHADPSHFERWGDAWDLAERCSAAGMRGFVLKCHHGSSVEAARLVDRRFPELTVFGGVALNQFVGGLNPCAVESCLALGGKIVWLPTIHARFHGDRCGPLGGFGFQKSRLRKIPEQGLTVLAEDGRLLDAVHEIIELVAEHDAVLATGHVSVAEIRALSRFIRELPKKPRLLVNHVEFKAPSLSADEIRELANEWTWFELAYISVSDLVRCATFESVAGLIGAVPAARWILASDSGQRKNPPAPEALERYFVGLRAQGIAEEALVGMLTREPEALLGIR